MKRKLKIGDIVRIHTTSEGLGTNGAVGKIIDIQLYMYKGSHIKRKYPYMIKFMDNKHKEIPFGGWKSFYNKKELEKLTEKETIAWLI